MEKEEEKKVGNIYKDARNSTFCFYRRKKNLMLLNAGNSIIPEHEVKNIYVLRKKSILKNRYIS